MKTVKDYRDLGLVFVDDDMIHAVTGEPSYGSTSLAKCLFKCGEYPSGIKLVGSMCGMGEWIPSSFAWRNNDGVKPEYRGVIEVALRNGSTCCKYDSDAYLWPKAFSSVFKWRPVVFQSESPTVSPKEDKPMKPVYTAEMHAKGELPPVGSSVALIVGSKCKPEFLNFRDNCIIETWDEGDELDVIAHTIICEVMLPVVKRDDKVSAIRLDIIKPIIKPIIKTIKVNGFDVPAPMSESPEVGTEYFVPSINSDDFVDCYDFHGDSYDRHWLSRGLIHFTKSAAIAHAKAMLGIDPNA